MKDSVLVISDFPELQYQKDSGTPALRLLVEALQKEYTVYIHTIQQPENQIARKLGYYQTIRNNLYEAVALYETINFDLVYGAGCYSTSVAAGVTIRTSIPSIGRLFGTYLLPHLGDPIQLAIKHEEVAAFRSDCTKFIITNDGTGGDVVAMHFGIPENKLYFWMNGVENPPDRKRPEDNNIRFISMARLERWKRVDRIITAFLEVAKNNPNVYLDIVGNGPECRNLKDLAFVSSHLAKQIHFHGQVPRNEALQMLADSDVFISTNDYSNVSNSLLEAMSAGKCCIALDTGNTRSVLGAVGVLVNSDSGVVTAMERVVNTQVREKLGKMAKDHANKTFITWDKRIEKEMQVVRSLMK